STRNDSSSRATPPSEDEGADKKSKSLLIFPAVTKFSFHFSFPPPPNPLPLGEGIVRCCFPSLSLRERAGVRGRCPPSHVVRLITKFISFISKVLTHTQKNNFHYL